MERKEKAQNRHSRTVELRRRRRLLKQDVKSIDRALGYKEKPVGRDLIKKLG